MFEERNSACVNVRVQCLSGSLSIAMPVCLCLRACGCAYVDAGLRDRVFLWKNLHRILNQSTWHDADDVMIPTWKTKRRPLPSVYQSNGVSDCGILVIYGRSSVCPSPVRKRFGEVAILRMSASRLFTQSSGSPGPQRSRLRGRRKAQGRGSCISRSLVV
jgi:hypothetical protein